jgi:hypothetical protein
VYDLVLIPENRNSNLSATRLMELDCGDRGWIADANRESWRVEYLGSFNDMEIHTQRNSKLQRSAQASQDSVVRCRRTLGLVDHQHAK